MKKIIPISVFSVVLLAHTNISQASMRCGNNLINEGFSKFEVIQKCGEPKNREVIDPVIGSNNKTPNKSVSVENWVYEDWPGFARNSPESI